MATTTERDALPTWSAHTLVMTLLEGGESFNGHCTCDRWSYRTNDWADLGTKWAWHYVAGSEGPDGHPFTQQPAVAECGHGDDCECPGCWEDTVARRVARGAAHQRVACLNCGCCVDCDDPGSPDHEDCLCPRGQSRPVEVAA